MKPTQLPRHLDAADHQLNNLIREIGKVSSAGATFFQMLKIKEYNELKMQTELETKAWIREVKDAERDRALQDWLNISTRNGTPKDIRKKVFDEMKRDMDRETNKVVTSFDINDVYPTF